MIEMVFVYGSLLRGERNHPLLANARFLAEGVTASAGYMMVSLGEFPAVYRGCGAPAGGRVEGELFSLGRELLAQIDALEGHPQFYCRRLVGILTQPRAYRAWMYELSEHQVLARPHTIVSGMNWRERERRLIASGD